jgi:chloramphenicol-sensitive protein RarD
MNTGGEVVDRRRGLLAGFGAYGTWGLFPLYFHHTPPTSAFEILLWRMVLTLAVVCGLLLVRGELSTLNRLRHEPLLRLRVALAAVLIASNWGLYIWAVANGHVVESALGYFINPVVTVAVGVVVLHERLRRAQFVAVALGAVAVIVLTVDYGRPPLIALYLACSFAAYGFLKKKIDLPAVVSLAGETLVLFPVGLVGLVVMGSMGRIDVARHGTGHFVLIALIGFITAVPLSWFAIAARNLPLTTIGLMQYMAPIMILLLGVLVFHEKVAASRWVGFGLVWVALVVLAIDALSSTRPARIEAVPVQSGGNAPT